MKYFVETRPEPVYKWLIRWKLYPIDAHGDVVDEDGDQHGAVELVDCDSFLVDL